MPDMIDAVVLVHALGVAMGRIKPESRHWESARASHHLVDASEALVMSAINWFEVMRGMTEEQREPLSKWRGRIDILPVDAVVALRAAQIHAAARRSGKVCPKCFCFKAPLHCDACGNQRSEPQRSHDIIMVATADVASDVSVLYSWDKGVFALADHVVCLTIRNPPPPPPQQIELIGATPIRDGSRARKKSKDQGRDG